MEDAALLARLAADFDSEAMPYASRPDPANGPSFPRYDHLARVEEWRIAENGAALSGIDGKVIRPPALHRPDFDPAVFVDASNRQAAASDPASSVFVSANAGTGKTKLLTDRVLRPS